MTAVVFETPGLIDLRAFTVMGAHAKPNTTNPIGYFGTGLKYAIAVLVRLGAEPVVWRGRDKITFTKKVSTFRGSPLETIVMKVLKEGGKRPTAYEMPFTTSYGRNWQPWMAFRELESNTRDEGGRTVLIDAPDKWDLFHGGPDAGKTYVVIDQPDFLKAAEEIDSIFLPRGRRSGVLLEAFPGESDHVYYRTMRALDLGKPSVFTYNVLEVLELTENRSIAYTYHLKDLVARWVLTEATEEQVEAVLTAEQDNWEHGMTFPGHVPPSEAFRAVMKRRPRGLSKASWSYYGSYAGSRSYPRGPWRLSEVHPRPWRVEGLEVKDANNEPVLAAPDGYYDDWERVAEAIVKRINVGLWSEANVPVAPEQGLEVVLVPKYPATADDPIPF